MGLWDFIASDCHLTWHGITIYGAIDTGVALGEPRCAVGPSSRARRGIHYPKTEQVIALDRRAQWAVPISDWHQRN
jgi:hypothetical protein